MDQLNKSNEVGKVDEQTTKLAVIEPRNECIIVTTSTLGIVSDIRKQILQNTLEGKLKTVSHLCFGCERRGSNSKHSDSKSQ